MTYLPSQNGYSIQHVAIQLGCNIADVIYSRGTIQLMCYIPCMLYSREAIQHVAIYHLPSHNGYIECCYIAKNGYSTLAIWQFGWCNIAKVVYSKKKCYIAVTQGSRWPASPPRCPGPGRHWHGGAGGGHRRVIQVQVIIITISDHHLPGTRLGSLLYSTFFGYIPPWLYSTSQTAIEQGCYIHFVLYSNMLYSHSVTEGGIQQHAIQLSCYTACMEYSTSAIQHISYISTCYIVIL